MRVSRGALTIVLVFGAVTTAARAQPSGVTLTLSVELRGKLVQKDKQIAVHVLEAEPGDPAQKAESIWMLDLADDKELAKLAKQFDGKDVIVHGTCRLLGIKTQTRKYKAGALTQPENKLPLQVATSSSLDLERVVRVQSLKLAQAAKGSSEAPAAPQKAKDSPPGPLRIEIAADQEDFLFRGPVLLRVTYTNISKKPIVLSANGTSVADGFPGEIFTLASPAGRTVYTVQAIDPSVPKITLPPGDSWKRKLKLNELFSNSGVTISGKGFNLGALPDPFGRVGEYSIQLTYQSVVKREAPVFTGQAESNTVGFKVVRD
jgi:hypothetical protein